MSETRIAEQVSAAREESAPSRASSIGGLKGKAPYLFLAAMVVAFLVVPALAGTSMTPFNIYNAFQTFASLGVLSVALGLSMIAREFDLSVLGVYALSGMVAVKTGEQNPLLGIAAALAVSLVWGIVQGAAVTFLRLPSAALTVGGYILLLGVTATISSSKSVPFHNFDVADLLDTPVLQVFSVRSLIALGLLALLALAMTYTRFGRDVRAVGSERRASRRAGVRVDGALITVFALTSLLAGLAGALLAYSLAAATPDPGFTPLIFALTASLLGGISLRGGTGTVLGIAAGAIGLALLQEILTIVKAPSWTNDLVTGLLLVVAAVIAAPGIFRLWQKVRSRRALAGAERTTTAATEKNRKVQR